MFYIEIATELILKICGGEASKFVITGKNSQNKKIIKFEIDKFENLIGIPISTNEAHTILSSLGFKCKKSHKNLIIGNNKPYSGRLNNDTLYKHATVKGLSNILIEIRQDLIIEKKGQKFFANLISKPLLSNKDNPILFEKSFYPSLAK